jgi:transposase-like protein
MCDATVGAQVVLELLKETKTHSQLTSEYGVHATVLRDWKQAAIKGLPDVFERRGSLTDVKAAYERQAAVDILPTE